MHFSSLALLLVQVISGQALGYSRPTESEELVKMINQARARHQIRPIDFSPKLTALAKKHYLNKKNNNDLASTSLDWHGPAPCTNQGKNKCMSIKPKKLVQYSDRAVELVSTVHGSCVDAMNFLIYANQDKAFGRDLWSCKPWKAVGAYCHRGKAIVWFGQGVDPSGYPVSRPSTSNDKEVLYRDSRCDRNKSNKPTSTRPKVQTRPKRQSNNKQDVRGSSQTGNVYGNQMDKNSKAAKHGNNPTIGVRFGESETTYHSHGNQIDNLSSPRPRPSKSDKNPSQHSKERDERIPSNYGHHTQSKGNMAGPSSSGGNEENYALLPNDIKRQEKKVRAEYGTDVADLYIKVNAERLRHSLPTINFSKKLAYVANKKCVDMEKYYPFGEENAVLKIHDWGGSGFPCRASESGCIQDKPKQLAGFNATGYEISFAGKGHNTTEIFALWLWSEGHKSVILSTGDYAGFVWQGVGIGRSKRASNIWFSLVPDAKF